MDLITAKREKAKIKMALQGPSGSGKTYSSLLLAFGLCGNWSKIAVIDTENHSSDLYAHLGEFKVLALGPPFTPERYIEALLVCEKKESEVIIIDSLSHEWEFLLVFHANLQGNSFTNWGKITPRHNTLVHRIMQSPCHVISTIRRKQDYVLNESNGKIVPEKVGLKSIQREGLEYEFTLVFDLDMKNYASVSKDRTSLFSGQQPEKISEETGKLIKNWCEKEYVITANDISSRINDCKSIKELLQLYTDNPQFKDVLKPEFENQKRRILINNYS